MSPLRAVAVLLVVVAACKGGTSEPAPSVPPAVAPADAAREASGSMQHHGELDASVAGATGVVDAAAARARTGEEDPVAYAQALSGEGEPAGSGMGERGPGTDLAAQLDRALDAGDRVAVPVDGKAIPGAVTIDDTSSSQAVIVRKIQTAYLSGLKRCHKEALKLDPKVDGRMPIAFGINERGRVVDVKVDGPTPALIACVEQQAARWTFAPVTDADGAPTSTTFQMTLQLRVE